MALLSHLAYHVRAHAEPLEILGQQRKGRVQGSGEADAERGEDAVVDHVPPRENGGTGR